MKLNLTVEEAQAAIAEHIDSPKIKASDITIGLNGTDLSSEGDYIGAIIQAQREFPAFQSNQKIACIRRIRELNPGCSLTEAKYAVEFTAEAVWHFFRTGQRRSQYN